MRNHRIVAAVVLASLAVASSARAQDGAARAKSRAPVEITPYGFLGSGGSSGVGAAIRWPLTTDLSVELETTVRRGHVGTMNTNFSLLFDFPEVGRVTPYVAGGIGLDQYVFTSLSPAGSVVPNPATVLSVNAGGGLRIRSDESWGIRTDARWFNGAGQAPERLRLFNGVTFKRNGR